MTAPDAIRKLCETFSLHLEHYKSVDYNETELRREFLDPSFERTGKIGLTRTACLCVPHADRRR